MTVVPHKKTISIYQLTPDQAEILSDIILTSFKFGHFAIRCKKHYDKKLIGKINKFYKIASDLLHQSKIVKEVV